MGRESLARGGAQTGKVQGGARMEGPFQPDYPLHLFDP